MKSVNERKYQNSKDLEEMMHDQGFKNFEIAESIEFEGSEIHYELNPNDQYIGHSDPYGSLVLITTDYNKDINKCYRPMMVCEVDDNTGSFKVIRKFYMV